MAWLAGFALGTFGTSHSQNLNKDTANHPARKDRLCFIFDWLVVTPSCRLWVNRHRNAMSAARPLFPITDIHRRDRDVRGGHHKLAPATAAALSLLIRLARARPAPLAAGTRLLHYLAVTYCCTLSSSVAACRGQEIPYRECRCVSNRWQGVGLRLQKPAAVIDHVVGEDAAVGIFSRASTDRTSVHRAVHAPCRSRQSLRRERNFHIVSIRYDNPSASFAIVHRLAGVVLQLRIVGVEKATDARMARAIDMVQLAILPQAASSPDAEFGFRWSSLVGSSTAVEKTSASVFESTPVHGDLPVK